MGTKTHTLCERLKETVDLLVGNREEHWAEWLRTALGRIENGDLSGIDHLLSAYGGMVPAWRLLLPGRCDAGNVRTSPLGAYRCTIKCGGCGLFRQTEF